MKHYMKKILVVFLCIFAMLLLSCGNSEEINHFEESDHSIELTLDNYEQYFDLSVVNEPETIKNNTVGNYFDTIKVSVKTIPASQFLKFRDCEIIVRANCYCDNEKISIDVPVKLNLGGNGSNLVTKKLENAVYFNYGLSENYDAIGKGNYEVISVKGSVEEVQ